MRVNPGSEPVPHPGLVDLEHLGARRYLVMLEQMRAEHVEAHGGSERGWKTAAARRLGISDVMVGYIVGDGETTKPAGGTTIVAAMTRIGLDPRFFYDPRLGDAPKYTDHVRWKSDPDAKMPAAWDEFLTLHGARLELEPEEIAWLREVRAHRVTPTHYLQAIIIRRDGLAPEDAERSAQVTADAAKIAEGLGVRPFDPNDP